MGRQLAVATTEQDEEQLPAFIRQTGDIVLPESFVPSKDFAAPEGLDYDVETFSRWYDSVARWIKSNAAGRVRDALTVNFLGGAWHAYRQSGNARK